MLAPRAYTTTSFNFIIMKRINKKHKRRNYYYGDLIIIVFFHSSRSSYNTNILLCLDLDCFENLPGQSSGNTPYTTSLN